MRHQPTLMGFHLQRSCISIDSFRCLTGEFKRNEVKPLNFVGLDLLRQLLPECLIRGDKI